MVNQLNKEILNKVDEIIKDIESSNEYQKYLLLKDKISNDKELIRLINEVKILQKDVVHHLNKKDLLKEKLEELDNNPLYREYNNTISEINNTFAIIESSINNYFQNKLNQSSIDDFFVVYGMFYDKIYYVKQW